MHGEIKVVKHCTILNKNVLISSLLYHPLAYVPIGVPTAGGNSHGDLTEPLDALPDAPTIYSGLGPALNTAAPRLRFLYADWKLNLVPRDEYNTSNFKALTRGPRHGQNLPFKEFFRNIIILGQDAKLFPVHQCIHNEH